MATLDQLKSALVNAHNAGDTNAAKILAGEILKMQAAGDPAEFPTRAASMNHDQMVEAYRATKPGDPWGDYLAQRLQQPMQGETKEQANVRASGKGSTDRVDMSTTGKAASTFLQGVPFAGEYMDEGLGWLAGKMGLQSQEDATNAIRAGQADMDQNNPKAATALRVGGGLTGTVVGAAALPAVPAPASLLGKSLAGGGIGLVGGGAEGIVSGYGSGTDAQSRTANAQSRGLLGAGMGAILGTAAPVVAEGASRGLKWAADKLTTARRASQQGMSVPTAKLLGDTMEADGSLYGSGAANIAKAGPNAMLADAGPGARTLLDTAANRSGTSARLAREAVEGRATDTRSILEGGLDATLGRPQGVETTVNSIRTGTAGARGSAYDAAYNSAIDYLSPKGQNLQSILSRVPKSALAAARDLMETEGVSGGVNLIDENLKVTRMPDVREWDYITRGLQQVADEADGAGKLGGTTPKGLAYGNLKSDIRGILRDLVPDYGTALDTAGDAIEQVKAVRFGQTLLSPSTTREEVALTIKGMTDGQKAQIAQGVRSNIDDMLANVEMAMSDPNIDAREAVTAIRKMSSKAAREKIEMVIGPEKAARLFATLDEAAPALQLRASIAQNSKTFPRQEMDRVVDDTVKSGVWNAFKRGDAVNVGKRAWQNLTGATDAGVQAERDKVYEEAVRALTRGNPQGLLGAIQYIQARDPRNAAIAKLGGGLLGYGAFGPVGYQLGTQLLGRPSQNPR